MSSPAHPSCGDVLLVCVDCEGWQRDYQRNASELSITVRMCQSLPGSLNARTPAPLIALHRKSLVIRPAPLPETFSFEGALQDVNFGAPNDG